MATPVQNHPIMHCKSLSIEYVMDVYGLHLLYLGTKNLHSATFFAPLLAKWRLENFLISSPECYYQLRCSVPHPSKLYGLPKLHKPGLPMRPIVSFCGSPTPMYQLSKYLTTILQPLTDKSQRKLQSMENFIDAIKTVQIPDNYKLVSFDVKSVFTSIPLQLPLQCTKTSIQQSTIKLPLPTEDIMDLPVLNLCLKSSYLQYNGRHYKQLHGTAMGSPVSVVIVEVVMQHMEERALATCRQTIPLWLRYVDTFTTIHKD